MYFGNLNFKHIKKDSFPEQNMKIFKSTSKKIKAKPVKCKRHEGLKIELFHAILNHFTEIVKKTIGTMMGNKAMRHYHISFIFYRTFIYVVSF